MPSQLIVHDDCLSDAIGVNRTLGVYLPAGYGRDTRRQFPILVLHDGQNVFDGRTSCVLGRCWRAREATWAERLPAVLEWLYPRKKT